jgi:ornithine cyclodeaminase/alanine dehydrogenase-like protein (mu-crystallin family)
VLDKKPSAAYVATSRSKPDLYMALLPSVVHLDASTLRELTPFPSLIDALASAFASPPSAPERERYSVSNSGALPDALLVMPAWRTGELMGVKLVTVFPGNASHGLATINGLYVLFSAATGELLATIDAEELTARRTVAASALASRYLSRPESSMLLVVGTGRIASRMAAAHAAVRPITEILVWGRDTRKAQALAQELNRTTGIGARPAENLHESVAAADIVSTATLSQSPLIEAKDVRPGTHIDLVGGFTSQMIEAEGKLIASAKLYVDQRSSVLREAGDIQDPIARGLMTADHIQGELGDLCRSDVPGRQDSASITVFKSVGVALEDLACASLAWHNLAARTAKRDLG